MHHEPPESDWERAEISSLLKEAQTLRSQKEQLEAQIAQAEDANASLQSWGASRVSTALAISMSFSERPSPLKAEEVFEDEDRSEVLFASQQTLQMDLEILRGRLAEAEAGRIRGHEETLAFQVQEDQAKELARLLYELQALQGHVDKKNSELMALNQENNEQALLALNTGRAKLREESDALKEEMLAVAEAIPKAARKQQQVMQEAQRAQRGLQEAQDLWHAQVNITRNALKVEENELAKLSGCREALHLALLEGRRASLDLSGKVAQLRSEYGRLLNWQQAHSAQSESDPFGLEAMAAELRRRIQSQEEELQERRQDAEDQANLQRKRAEEALALGALQAKTAAELRALEVCSSHLHRLGREMTQEAASLQLERQRELSLISALRSELQKSGKAASGPRRSTSAPQLRCWSGTLSKKAPKKVSVRIQRLDVPALRHL